MIKAKRDSLEKFIRAQFEGPGACNNRFQYIDENQSNDDIIDVVNTTPGSLYSTAILFPKRIPNPLSNESFIIDDSGDTNEEININDNPETYETKNESGENELENISQAEEDDLCSLSQRYPTSVGISCCLNSKNIAIDSNAIKITISGRYYTKIPKDKYHCVHVIVNDHYNELRDFYNRFKERFCPYFQLKANSISPISNFHGKYIDVKQLIIAINLEITEEIAKDQNGELDYQYLSIGGSYRYLKSYKEKLWGTLKQVKDKGTKYISETEKKGIIERIEKIELYETFLSYFEDVAFIYNSKSFGYWIARKFSEEIDLSNIDLNIQSNKQIFSPKDSRYDNLRYITCFDFNPSEQASISVWLQVTKNSRENDSSHRYLKIQLENTSTPFQEDNKHYFSAVTEKVNQRCFFGVEIKVESEYLSPYHYSSKNIELNDDIDQLNFLYRSIKDYGVGHVCSVDWIINDGKKIVKSEFIPSFETPDVEPVPRDKYSEYVKEGSKLVPKRLLEDTKPIEFKWLSTFSEATDDEVVAKLIDFVDAYGSWINRLKLKSNGNKFADHNIDLCSADYIRMKSNVTYILHNNPANIRSFRLMNSAMFIQLWHSKRSTRKETTRQFYVDASDHIFGDFSATWRPFQIAFILLNLDGIFQRKDDPKWNKRNELVDLVWFPTGGGKTEAYLGIIALTIIHRRINEDKARSGGTTAIMRYTLRLLATQQFQRAMRVILALEQLRIWEPNNLGSEPISIGLYVGKDSLPNSAKDLLEECKKWNNFKGEKRSESKIPLDKCPWCGELLEFQNVGTESSPEIRFQCKNINCTFSQALPVILCDDYIYKNPPTLLFGTVDKFASIGHRVDIKDISKDSRRIFGKGLLNNIPPELIIQDELHLLLGPLGSAVSLFESAVDQLCSYRKTLSDGSEILVRPKIISSTATTRNTE